MITTLSPSASPPHRVATPARAPCLERSDGTSVSLEDDAIVVRDHEGRELMKFGADGVRITAITGDLTLSAPRGRVVIEAAADVEMSASRLLQRCETIVTAVGRWELRAQRVVETAGDVYRQVDGVIQTRAGRLRQLIAGTSQLIAKRATVVCDEDVSLDGRRILLG